MSWFKRREAGILTEIRDQNEIPNGYWVKCSQCSEMSNRRAVVENLKVCPNCSHHFHCSSTDYFDLLFDDGEYALHDGDIYSIDPLQFRDKKNYVDRLEAAQSKTGQADAAKSATGKIGGFDMSVAAMDFSFIGGSMGSVVGEILSRAIKRAYTTKSGLLIISQSGGARMMEAAYSLMQMAKTSAHLARLAEEGLPYFSLMTHPTTGGVTASYAMLGDFNLAEPNALIGFAGPRVIRETIGRDLPEGFQRSEFLLEKGFVDLIVERSDLRSTMINLLSHTVTPSRQ